MTTYITIKPSGRGKKYQIARKGIGREATHKVNTAKAA